jgi:hypothetical protein
MGDERGGKAEMNQSPEKPEDRKTEIVTRIGELSRLLGMTPSDGAITMQEPLTQNTMVLSDWLGAARDSFFKLSLVLSKELDIQLQ